MACRGCGGLVAAEVWVIVDSEERPDLMARLRAGTLHDLSCPHCGHTATVNAPLLVVRPSAVPALLFSPAGGDDRARDEAQAVALLGLAREDMGAAWRDEWLGDGVVGVARAALPAALDAAAVDRLAAVAEDVPPAVRAALEEVLRALAAEGVRVTSAEAFQRALDERPLLAARVMAALREV